MCCRFIGIKLGKILAGTSIVNEGNFGDYEFGLLIGQKIG
jgi:hypothetical protein